MLTAEQKLVDLETRFWQSLVDQDTDTALGLLSEPALMVSSHGAMKFDHAGYRKMAEQGSMIVTSFELEDMQVVFPNPATAILTYRVKQGVKPRGKGEGTVEEMHDSSTWVRMGNDWKCVMHTETRVAKQPAMA
jgi:hypothetical protein